MLQEFLTSNVKSILGLIVVVLTLTLFNRRPPGIPPGPWLTLPVIGNLLQIGSNPVTSFRKMRKKYGDVFSVYFANRLVIVINGMDNLKDAFVKNGKTFSDRPNVFFTGLLTYSKGVGGSSGDTWKEQRKFAVETLKNFGMGKNILEGKVQEELTAFIEALTTLNGKATDIKHLIGTSVCNIISSIVFGERFEYDDPQFVNFLNITNENITISPALNFFPFLRFLPGDLFRIKRMMRGMEIIKRDLFDHSIEEHMNKYDEDNADDFISAYIKEMKKKEGLGETSTSMNRGNLRAVIQDLFLGGTETTATTIRWLLLYFMHFPQIQHKMFTEVNDKIGCDRPVCLKDKTDLPYLEATILETLRYADIGPLSVFRCVSKETTFKGFRIPKDAILVPVIDSVLSDPDIWGDPENFRPERFLDGNGRLTKPEEHIAFMIGGRNCPGESLARMELFLFVAAMVQKFEFLPQNGNVLPTLDSILGLTQSPKPYVVRVVLRK